MLICRLTVPALLAAALPGTTCSISNAASDDSAGTVKRVITTSSPANSNTDGGERNDLLDGTFTLTRSQVDVPFGEAQAFWYCSGGTDGVFSRLVVFAPDVPFEDIAIDTSTWQDPIVDDWNSTINAEAIFMDKLTGWVAGGGSVCACAWTKANFGEWLKSNSDMGSAIATDLYQSASFDDPPSNWYFPPEYLPPNANVEMIQRLNTGEPLSSASSGWQTLTTLKGTSLITTTNKSLRIENNGGRVTLRAISNGPKAYGIVAYLFKENPDPSDQQDNGPINPMKLFTSDVIDVTQATAMTFAPIPEGYYYSLFIENDFEEQTQSSDVPPYECAPGPYGLTTQYDIQYSLQTCEEAACNAGTITVVDSPPVPPPTPTTSSAEIFGREVALKAITSIFAVAFVTVALYE